MLRRDEARVVAQEERGRGISGQATGQVGDQQFLRGSRVEEREDGELQRSEARVGRGFQTAEVAQQHLPSQESQEELAKTQATGAAVISDPMDTESGLQEVKSLIGNVTEVDVDADTDNVMEMDEIRAVFLEHGVDMDAVDDLPECSEGEMEEALRELEQASGEETREDGEVANVEDEKDMAEGDVGKKHRTRKRLFNPTISTAVSTKMRIAKALVSPRKRAAGKTGTRHGETVCGSQKNEGLQYDVTRIDLCLVVTKELWFYRVSSYDNLLHLIGHCLWCRNTTLMLWSGVRERACWFKKAGQQRTLLSSPNIWMHSLCRVSSNPSQRALAMRGMGLSRESRSWLTQIRLQRSMLRLMRWGC
ncbi:hypothetical protein F2Q70_00015212 [Brassica cretica]|uniref:Uncharacterized protein n=1 Tax=Brassica cretica TaxID=69181 RepID=A0A8S9HVS7_BRACR|nr:hypothetical protein F2Q70_00015212 [Brassica cretica]KAF2599718.1 hypothetical protein F2Q68_00008306 [Brassica cretica]